MVEEPASSKPTTRSPKFLTGIAGNQAMNLWERIYSAEGEVGINRADKELDVFVWSVQGKQLWKFLVRTPDVLIEKERKIEVIRDHLQTMGCSQLFIDTMAEMFEYDNLQLLEQVAADFHAINREHRREVDVSLFTPAALDAAALEFYKATISLNYLKEGDNLIFSHHVDTSITSGYRVVVKDKLYDFTRDNARKQFFASLELSAASKLSQAESRVKSLPKVEVTEAIKKEADLPAWGIDASFLQKLEELSTKRKKEFAEARVQLLNKKLGTQVAVTFE
jgi:F0F1-type ATP synthase delta subunit